MADLRQLVSSLYNKKVKPGVNPILQRMNTAVQNRVGQPVRQWAAQPAKTYNNIQNWQAQNRARVQNVTVPKQYDVAGSYLDRLRRGTNESRALLKKPGIGNKAFGGLTTAATVFDATPVGMGTSALIAGVTALKDRSQGQNFGQAFNKRIADPYNMPAEDILGVKGVAAIPLNMALLNPKGSLKSIKNIRNIKGIAKGLKTNTAKIFRPDDVASLDRVSDVIRIEGLQTTTGKKATKVLDTLADAYLTKAEIDNVWNGKGTVKQKTIKLITSLQKKVADAPSDSSYYDYALGITGKSSQPPKGVGANQDFSFNIGKNKKQTIRVVDTPEGKKLKVVGTNSTSPRLDLENQNKLKLRQLDSSKTGLKLQTTKQSQESQLPRMQRDTQSGTTYYARTPKDTSQRAFYTPDSVKTKQAESVIEAVDQPQTFNKLFAQYVGNRDAAKTTATDYATDAKFTAVPANKAKDVISYLEGSIKGDGDVQKLASPFKKALDDLYKEVNKAGIPVKYWNNYVPHFWKESPEEVAQMFMSAKGKFKNAKQRVLPTYTEGIQMGLTPKYTHPAQILEAYVRGFEKVKANIDFLEGLKKNNLLVDESVGRSAPGFTPIIAPGIGRSESAILDQIYVGNWYAPNEIAKQINKLFSEQDPSTFSRPAKISSGFQDIYLSGGVPGTPINAFTFGQTIKDISAGRIISPFQSIARATFPGWSAKYFKEKAPVIKQMQRQNIPLQTNFTVDQFVSQEAIKRGLGENIGRVWHKLVNEPTFKRYMPMQQIDLFEKAFNSLIKDGKSQQEAEELAAKAVKNFYGLISSDKMAKRSQLSKDITSTVFFAPRYRESMINFWGKNLLAMKKPLAPENIYNTRFIVGSAIMFALYDYVNKKTTGNHLWENPRFKQDKLLIPVDEETTIGIPFLPSVAYLPRTAVSIGQSLVEGDMQSATGDAMGFLSPLTRPVADVMRNRDYFGRAITYKDDTPKEKWGKIGKHLAVQYTGHPYVREVIDPANREDPAYQRISRAMESPLRFYSGLKVKAKENTKLEANTLPTAKEDLATLYKSATNTVEGYREKRVKSEAGLTQTKVEDLQADVDQAIKLKKQIEKEHPELILDIGIDTYKSGGGATTEDRAKWVAEKLESVKTEEEYQEILNKLYDGNVLTKSVIEELAEAHDISLNEYTEGGKRKSTGKTLKAKKPKKITVSTPTIKAIKFAAPKRLRVSIAKAPKLKVYKPKKIKLAQAIKAKKFAVIKPKVTSTGKRATLKAKR